MATPTTVKHCVTKLAAKYGGDTSKAFAICVAQMQKAGYLKKGSVQSTSKGKKADKRHASEKEAGKKMKSYERFLKAARKRKEEAEAEEANPALSEIRRFAGLEPSHPGWEVPDIARETKPLNDQQRRIAGLDSMTHTPWVLDED